MPRHLQCANNTTSSLPPAKKTGDKKRKKDNVEDGGDGEHKRATKLAWATALVAACSASKDVKCNKVAQRFRSENEKHPEKAVVAKLFPGSTAGYIMYNSFLRTLRTYLSDKLSGEQIQLLGQSVNELVKVRTTQPKASANDVEAEDDENDDTAEATSSRAASAEEEVASRETSLRIALRPLGQST